MRLLAALIAVSLGIGSPGAQVEQAEVKSKPAECRYMYAGDGKPGFTDWEVKQTIRCVTKKYGLNTSQALMIASHESGFNEWARNTSSGACGIFQHIPTYWSGRIAAAERSWPTQRKFSESCFNARSNIYAAAKLAKSSGGWYYHWCRFASYC